MSRASRWLAAALLPVGPAAIAVLRLVLPYDTTDDAGTIVRKVAADPGTQSLVVWLGFAGVLGSLLAGQASTIVNGFPRYVDSLIRWVNSTFHTRLSQRTVFNRLPELVKLIRGR